MNGTIAIHNTPERCIGVYSKKSDELTEEFLRLNIKPTKIVFYSHSS